MYYFKQKTAYEIGVRLVGSEMCIRDRSYYFKPGTKDENMPFNNAVVTLMPDNIAVTLDNLNNGFFMFDSLAPGNYEIICSGIPDYFNQTLDVAVTAGKT